MARESLTGTDIIPVPLESRLQVQCWYNVIRVPVPVMIDPVTVLPFVP